MLNISKLTLGYDRRPVLHFPGMALAEGGQCLITGASGSGKTTLLYTMAGLVAPMQGHITINGTEITKFSEAGRDRFRGRHIGMIFQTLHLVKSLPVMDNLLLASYLAGLPQDRQRAADTLKALDLYHKRDALPHTLSQGQAQRVAIARAILHRPALILADEPTSSLDDQSCAAVISLIRKAANDSGAMLVISTHDSRVKAHFSKVIAL